MSRKSLAFLLVGVLSASVLGITTDQIIQNVYDSANTALRANIVAGGTGGTITGSGTANLVTKFTGATAIGNSSITDNGTTVSTSEALSVGALSYSGTLNASDIHDNGSSTTFTVAHRFEACGAAASGTVTGTLPASPTVGDIYTLIQKNASQSCVLSRAGSQTIDGATTATLTSGVAIGKDCTVIYIASNNWHASGACT